VLPALNLNCYREETRRAASWNTYRHTYCW